MEKVGNIFRQSSVNVIQDSVKNSSATFVLSYSSVSASKMDALRKDLKRIDAKLCVSKNRLAKIALEGLEHGDLAQKIDAQMAFVWSDGDAVAISKALVNFSKGCDGFLVQGGLLDGAMLANADVQRLSELPPREILLAQLLQTMLSPMTRFAGLLNAKTRDLLSILKQLSEKKEGGN